MAENRLENTFQKDTKDFINQINDGLIQLENNGYSSEIINHIFRCIHSIKSEAAFLEYEEIASQAHKIESVIEPLRNVGTDVEVDPAMIAFCFETLDRITGLAETRNPDDEDEEAELIELLPEDEDEDEDVYTNDIERPYTEFELELLYEAGMRREKIYKVLFSVSEEETMVYARVYLAVNNLEKEMNVIKIRPELEKIQSGEIKDVEIILTTRLNEAAIASRLGIDQIKNIEIRLLDYKKEIENKPDDTNIEAAEVASVSTRERVINVEADEIDALSSYVTEIKKRINDLSSGVSDSSDFKGLENISDSIEKMMTNLKTVDFNSHFFGFKRNVRDIASKLGKKVELIFADENQRIDREFADFIAEPVLQIIRNSVVHGIESPDVRTAAGKNEIGTIHLMYKKDDRQSVLEVSDDGRGVDAVKIMSAHADSSELLNEIVKPGFTTHPHSAEFAGRGVGLDLVKTKIEKRGGKLELENSPGAGCLFRLIFRNKSGMEKLFVADSKGKTFAVRGDVSSAVTIIKPEDVSRIDGRCFYDQLQCINVDGRPVTEIEEDVTKIQALKISSGIKEACLIIDESLFEMSYDSSSLKVGESAGGFFRTLYVNDEPADYPVLDVAALLESL